MKEIDFGGLFLTPALAWSLLALLVLVALRRLLARAGFYRFVWHPPLVDCALFVILLSGMIYVARQL
ncbi:DUF1656 domain-containing protein [Marinivivus vitaminiproducens]|uniref:DUF1656 domain-containing protein n=1 Tax=Marinivivus vitaminiproducens TaxID=3035935 RepID=UPI0027A4025E|nr:DUF1656 domain-containing protein [Geminicoccaceae bacterium SCSIO 64248]